MDPTEYVSSTLNLSTETDPDSKMLCFFTFFLIIRQRENPSNFALFYAL
jgi:hypothetical protein